MGKNFNKLSKLLESWYDDDNVEIKEPDAEFEDDFGTDYEHTIFFTDVSVLKDALRYFVRSGKNARGGAWSVKNAGDGGFIVTFRGEPILTFYPDKTVEISTDSWKYSNFRTAVNAMRSVLRDYDFSKVDMYESKIHEDEDYASMVGADQLAKQFGLSDGQTKLLSKMFNKVASGMLKGGVGNLRNKLMGNGDKADAQEEAEKSVLYGALAMDAPIDMNTECTAKLAKMDGSAYYVFAWDGEDAIKAYYVDGDGNNGMITASFSDALADGYEPISYKETLGEIKDNEDF